MDNHDLDRTCCIRGCGRRLHNLSPVDVCRPCGMKIARTFEPEMAAERISKRGLAVERAATRRGDREGSVVYYVRIGDYIKIGYSARLRSRLNQLRVDPDALLAIEPGGEEQERMRHRQFQALRISHRENFHPGEALIEHAQELRALHELPRWASLPKAGRVTIRRVS